MVKSAQKEFDRADMVTRHYRNVGCTKEIRIIDAEQREFRLIVSVTVSGNEAQHILI
jgi:hypothetical protein